MLLFPVHKPRMNFPDREKKNLAEDGIRNFQMGRDLWDHVDSVVKSHESGWITVIILGVILEI